jgi:hypothetical protein
MQNIQHMKVQMLQPYIYVRWANQYAENSINQVDNPDFYQKLQFTNSADELDWVVTGTMTIKQ